MFQRYKASPEDLQHVGELGTGSCGHVVKMVHKPSGKVLAVKVSAGRAAFQFERTRNDSLYLEGSRVIELFPNYLVNSYH